MNLGITMTHCPYCGNNMTQSVYKWRILNLSSTIDNSSTYQVIEIYCASCHTTLSFIPVPAKN